MARAIITDPERRPGDRDFGPVEVRNRVRLNVFILSLMLPILGSGFPVGARAQQPPGADQGLPIAPGTRVRVTASNLVAPLVANYLELRGDTLILFEEGAGRGIWSVALGQVQRLEATAGEQRLHRPYMLRGALLGAGAGALGGLVFAATVEPSDPDRKYSRALSGLVGAAVGAGIGALIGPRFTTEGWVPIPLVRGVSLLPAPSGLVSLRVVF